MSGRELWRSAALQQTQSCWPRMLQQPRSVVRSPPSVDYSSAGDEFSSDETISARSQLLRRRPPASSSASAVVAAPGSFPRSCVHSFLSAMATLCGYLFCICPSKEQRPAEDQQQRVGGAHRPPYYGPPTHARRVRFFSGRLALLLAAASPAIRCCSSCCCGQPRNDELREEMKLEVSAAVLPAAACD